MDINRRSRLPIVLFEGVFQHSSTIIKDNSEKFPKLIVVSGRGRKTAYVECQVLTLRTKWYHWQTSQFVNKR